MASQIRPLQPKCMLHGYLDAFRKVGSLGIKGCRAALVKPVKFKPLKFMKP